jgi:hypothetical protein
MAIPSLFSRARVAGSRDSQQPAPAEAIAAVQVLNQDYITAVRTRGAAWFDQHMAEDVVVVLGNGRRVRKREFLQTVSEDPKRYRSLVVRNATLRAFGPTVQVDADAVWELDDGTAGVSRYIDTYAWLDGRWQVVSAQVTPLPRSAGGE